MNGKCLIISGGEYSDAALRYAPWNLIIACDKGYDHALKMGLRADVILGDFDSIEGNIDQAKWNIYQAEGNIDQAEGNIDQTEGGLSGGPEIISLSPEKDDTDTMYAARLALSRGYKDITLCCALKGRIDHEFANIQTGAFIASCNAASRIIGENELINFISGGSATVRRESFSCFSIYSITDKCTGVNITGAKYPLSEAMLDNTFPIGTSNEWTEDEATVSVQNGILMIIATRA